MKVITWLGIKVYCNSVTMNILLPFSMLKHGNLGKFFLLKPALGRSCTEERQKKVMRSGKRYNKVNHPMVDTHLWRLKARQAHFENIYILKLKLVIIRPFSSFPVHKLFQFLFVISVFHLLFITLRKYLVVIFAS